MTVLTSRECKVHKPETGVAVDVFVFGVGTNAGCTYVVVGCPFADTLRAGCGLPGKDLHVTLGFPPSTGDSHDVGKGLRTVKTEDANMVDNVLWCVAATAAASGRVAAACAPKNAEVMGDLHHRRPHDAAVGLALAKALANLGHLDEALVHATCVLDSVPASMVALRAQALFVAAKVKKTTGAGLGAEEARAMGTTLLGSVPGSACTGLFRILNGAIIQQPDPLTKTKTVFLATPRTGEIVEGELPWGFGAANPEATVFGCGIVKARHIPVLAALGVAAVVNLIGEEPPSSVVADAASEAGITIHHFPMADRCAPSKAHVHAIVEEVLKRAAPAAKVVVHCLGGVGRTNTVLAAYIMATTNKAPSEAVAWLEVRRPMKMTPPQLTFLKTYYADLVEAPPAADLSPPPPALAWVPVPTCPLPPLILLVGLPGAGKSTFAGQVLRACPDRAILICQDDLGRDGVEAAFAAAVKERTKPVIVLDKCNLTVEDRVARLNACPGPLRKAAVAVCVPTGVDECVVRMVGRAGRHPVIKGSSPESCRRIVEDMAGKFVTPTTKEGFHKVFASPDTFWAAHGCVLGGPPGPQGPRPKFPRTRHLANLGAMTRDDLLFDAKEVEAFLAMDVIVEEKVDGANLGLYLQHGEVMAQHRSNFVDTTSKQYDGLAEWMRVRSADIHRALGALGPATKLVLYGEWVAMTHTIPYTHLPDRFLVFDVFDATANAFLSRDVMDVVLEDTCFATARMPVLFSGRTTLAALKALAQTAKSAFYDGLVEGVYVKACENGVVKARGKLVRSDFLGPGGGHAVVHWTSGGLYRKNGINHA
jgi:atypical dual specificity phosphatase